MGKKPTRPFGHIRFGKDGTVQPEFSKLEDNQKGQERAVGENFIKLSDLPEGTKLEVLPENDHDLRITPPGDMRPMIVQCTEIVYPDFLLPAGQEALEHVSVDGVIRAIDVAARNNVLVKKIQNKRNYAKPKDAEFVLIIWTGLRDQFAIRPATEFLEKQGPGPFDRIVLFNISAPPRQIWPLDDRWKNFQPKAPPPNQGVIFIPATEMSVVKRTIPKT